MPHMSLRKPLYWDTVDDLGDVDGGLALPGSLSVEVPEALHVQCSPLIVLFLRIDEAEYLSHVPLSCCWVVSVGSTVFRSSDSGKLLCPRWTQSCRFVVDAADPLPIQVSLYARTGRKKYTRVAWSTFEVATLLEAGERESGAATTPFARWVYAENGASSSASSTRRRVSAPSSGGDSSGVPASHVRAVSGLDPLWVPGLSGEAGDLSLDEPGSPFSNVVDSLSGEDAGLFSFGEEEEDEEEPFNSDWNVLSSNAMLELPRIHVAGEYFSVESSLLGAAVWRDLASVFDPAGKGTLSRESLQELWTYLAQVPSSMSAARVFAALADEEQESVPVDRVAAFLVRAEQRDAQLAREFGLEQWPARLGQVCFVSCPVCSAELQVDEGDEVAAWQQKLRRAVHLKLCADDLSSEQQLAMSGFFSEDYAMQPWAARMLHQQHPMGRTLQSYICGNPKFVLCCDRETGRVVQEKIPGYVKTWLRFLYGSSAGRLASTLIKRRVLRQLTARLGRKFLSPKSVGRIDAFIKFHGIDMDQFVVPDGGFQHFNEFFYRKLVPGAREIAEPEDPSVAVSPADCRLLVFESVDEATRVWIKGKRFSLANLLPKERLRQEWSDCSMVLCRLAPQDYHRFHFPVSAFVGPSTLFDEGCLHSVNPLAVRSQHDVFTENRRWCTELFETAFGEVLIVAVGAAMVNSIVLTSQRGTHVRKGDEHGYFAFGGSTVLVLFPRGSIEFDADLQANSSRSLETLVRMGQSFGRAVGERRGRRTRRMSM